MKKVLLASTAVVAFAGAAFADDNPNITISGSAEMGIRGGNSSIETDGVGVADFDENFQSQFHTDVDVTFTLSGETDGGLSFGTSIDLDESGDGADSVDNDFEDGGIAIFISGDFGTVTMGDTDGALDFVMNETNTAGSPGSLADDETIHIGFLGSYLDGAGDGQIVRYDYAFEQFQFAISVEQQDDCVGGGIITDRDFPGAALDCDDDDLTWAIGFGYEFEFAGGSVDLGLGYQYAESTAFTIYDDSDWFTAAAVPDYVVGTGPGADAIAALGFSAALVLDSGFEATLAFTDFSFDADDTEMTHIGIGLGYSFDAFSVHVNYGQFDGEDNGNDFTATGFGIAAGYDLGGGAEILFGYGNSQLDDVNLDGVAGDDEFSANTYSLGLSFSF